MNRSKTARVCSIVLSVLLLHSSIHAMGGMSDYIPGDGIGGKLVHVGAACVIGHYVYKQFRPSNQNRSLCDAIKADRTRLTNLEAKTSGLDESAATRDASVQGLQEALTLAKDETQNLFNNVQKLSANVQSLDELVNGDGSSTLGLVSQNLQLQGDITDCGKKIAANDKQLKELEKLREKLSALQTPVTSLQKWGASSGDAGEGKK